MTEPTSSEGHQIVAAIAVTTTAVVLNFLFLGRVVTLLNAGLVMALLFWFASGSGSRGFHPRLGSLFLVSIAVQIVHFLEEYFGELYRTAPPLFDLEPIGSDQFVIFNVIWIIVFLVAAAGIYTRTRLALVAVWFMALVGGIGNTIVHSWIAARSGAYAPGLATALINLPIAIALVLFLLAGDLCRETE